MSRTLNQYVDECVELLRAMGAEGPDRRVVVRALNRAKDWAVAQIQDHDRTAMQTRTDYAVTSGLASVLLPGTDDAPAWRRIKGVHEVAADGREIPVPVFVRNDDLADARCGELALVREGNRLYFHPIPAPRTMTLRVRTQPIVADLDEGDGTAEWDGLLPEWETLIVLRSVAALTPNASRDNMSYLKAQRELEIHWDIVKSTLHSRLDAESARIRNVAGPRRGLRYPGIIL